MDIQNEKLKIIYRIIQTGDERLLKKIDLLLAKSGKMQEKPMSLEEFYDKIAASEKAFEEQKVIYHSDLKNEIKEW